MASSTTTGWLLWLVSVSRVFRSAMVGAATPPPSTGSIPLQAVFSGNVILVMSPLFGCGTTPYVLLKLTSMAGSLPVLLKTNATLSGWPRIGCSASFIGIGEIHARSDSSRAFLVAQTPQTAVMISAVEAIACRSSAQVSGRLSINFHGPAPLGPPRVLAATGGGTLPLLLTATSGHAVVGHTLKDTLIRPRPVAGLFAA